MLPGNYREIPVYYKIWELVFPWNFTYQGLEKTKLRVKIIKNGVL